MGFLKWIKWTLSLTVLLSIAQIGAVLMMKESYPVEVYEPATELVQQLFPEAWAKASDVPGGWAPFLLTVVAYSFVVAVVITVGFKALRNTMKPPSDE